MRCDNAEPDSRLVRDFLLQILGELLVTLHRDDRERVQVMAAQALALLVHAEPEAASDRLPAFPLRADLAQRADLKDIRIVPSLLQRGMRKDEPEVGVEREQLLLVFHDEVVGALRVVAIGLVVLGRVRPAPVPVDREVAVMNRFRIRDRVHAREQFGELGKPGGAAILLLEHDRVFSLHRVSVIVVGAVMLDPVDEEETEHLHTGGGQPLLLQKMLVDRPADHQALHDVRIDVAHRFAHAQEGFRSLAPHLQQGRRCRRPGSPRCGSPGIPLCR